MPQSLLATCDCMAILIEDHGVVDYGDAHARQLRLVEEKRSGQQDRDLFMLVEHPPVFTIGRNGSTTHLTVAETTLQERGIDLIRVERGGEITYHGPGQLVCYPIVNLKAAGLRVAEFTFQLEEIMIQVAAHYGVEAGRDPRNHGIWVGGRKLGSVGIAIKHGITFHGLALNVNCDLAPFSMITPCGLAGVAMTSVAKEAGKHIAMQEVKDRFIGVAGSVFAQSTIVRPVTGETGADNQPAVARSAKPKWLKKPLPASPRYEQTRKLVRDNRLHTVCREARCPNQFECFGEGTATFLIMGDRCTRNCRFCAVDHGPITRLDPDEPNRVADAAARMGLEYVVVTSVTRDDLADGGAAHFAATINALHERCSDIEVEVLIPDLKGNSEALTLICEAAPAVLNHNIETVARLYDTVRPEADYRRSLELIGWVSHHYLDIVTKSGIMVGLGETEEELRQTLKDLRRAGCDILTVGQYLQPTTNHHVVEQFYPPEWFEELSRQAEELGFGGVAAGVHVRSSYQAARLYRRAGANVR